MNKYAAIIVLAILSFPLYSQGYRIRAQDPIHPNIHVWGTCFSLGDKIITCEHVARWSFNVEVEVQGKWIKAELIKTRPELDVAVFKPIKGMKKLKRGKPRKGKCTIFGNEKNKGVHEIQGYISQIPYKPKDLPGRLTFFILGGGHPGSSGGPIMQDGKCVGFVVSAWIKDKKVHASEGMPLSFEGYKL